MNFTLKNMKELLNDIFEVWCYMIGTIMLYVVILMIIFGGSISIQINYESLFELIETIKNY